MTNRVRMIVAGLVVVLVGTASAVTWNAVPSIAAAGLLHPWRRPVSQPAPAGCRDATFAGVGVVLQGWRCHTSLPPRGTLVFLHGVADNRTSVAGAVDRFLARGFDLAAYDSRAHGNSGGEICTYGYWEKRDLRKVLDTVRPGPIILLGTSLGAAVAIQEAAGDPRVSGIVAAEVFSDLRTVARERAPRLLTEGMIRRAFARAEAAGAFRVDEVSPVRAAAAVRVPVLLIHGSRDIDTPPDHSRRVFSALAGSKELVLVPGAGHNESLRSEDVWRKIDSWVDRLLADRLR